MDEGVLHAYNEASVPGGVPPLVAEVAGLNDLANFIRRTFLGLCRDVGVKAALEAFESKRKTH